MGSFVDFRSNFCAASVKRWNGLSFFASLFFAKFCLNFYGDMDGLDIRFHAVSG